MALRESFTGIQNRIVELAQKDSDRRKNVEPTENEEPPTKPIVDLEQEIKEQANHKEMFEEEDKVSEIIPINSNISISEYRKYHETISTPLEAIHESNSKYRQLENSINVAQEKLDHLVEAEEKALLNEEMNQNNNDSNSNNNSKVDSSRSGSRKKSLTVSSTSILSNSRGNMSTGHRSKHSSILINGKFYYNH